MTSNIGSQHLLNNDNIEKVEVLVKQTFKPEFINRIDDIVIFKPLTKEVQLKVVDKLLNLLTQRLYDEHYLISFTKATKETILKLSYSYEYGARSLKRFIQKEIETMLAKAIVSEEIKINQKYEVDVKDGKFIITNT